jgi:hypothetical protein
LCSQHTRDILGEEGGGCEDGGDDGGSSSARSLLRKLVQQEAEQEKTQRLGIKAAREVRNPILSV